MNESHSRSQLADAFASADSGNPLAIEIAKALDRLAHILSDEAASQGQMPAVLRVPTPLSAIEIFAFDVFKREVSALGVDVRLIAQPWNA